MTTSDSNGMAGQTAAQDFDPAALQAKYRAEREKRLRPDGAAQYRVTEGEYAHFLDDPYVEPGFTRDPVSEDVDVAIIGGGFGGLLAAVRLREAGIGNFRIIEKAGDFGGTWYWNRYPGIACDIESYIYMPLLEELGYVPTEKYARGPEILRHTWTIGEKFGLYDSALFQTEVTELRWDEATARWLVSTSRGDAIRARFVTMSIGLLHRPKLPGIPGIETFKGHTFHTSRWDYAYTGGDSHGGLVGLADKRVGIIGTGSTALQCVPHLGRAAKHLYVFQRTPATVNVRANQLTDPQWAESLTPGWQQARMDNFNTLISGGAVAEDLVADGWTEILGQIGRRAALGGEAGAQSQLADFSKMEAIRARVDALVEDPATAAALKPYYNIMCKRPGFHDEYLQTFNRPNVTLVHTDGRGVDRVTEHGVVAGGQEYELDCLIYSTGFEFVTSSISLRTGYEIHGRETSLSEKWADGVSTLYGMHTRGFPNCFIMGNAQQAMTPNVTHMLSVVSTHIAFIVRQCLDRGIVAIEPTERDERAWVDEVMSYAEPRMKFNAECTPAYDNNEGVQSPLMVQNFFYVGGSLKFIRLLEDWRRDGALGGFELRHDADARPGAGG